MRTVIMIASVLFALTTLTLRAAENFDGLWASTKEECIDDDGPDSKTLIDLGKAIGGKPAPIVDRYENHCRVDGKTTVGNGMNLAVTCFEFWDNFEKELEGRKATIKLLRGRGGTLVIDGKSYLRCKIKVVPANR
jgi:hypothetical protein